jgi:hypothetical protein
LHKERRYQNAGSGGRDYSSLLLTDASNAISKDPVVTLIVSASEPYRRDVQLTPMQARDLAAQLLALAGDNKDEPIVAGYDFTK